MPTEDEESKGFQVRDRRRFTDTGEPRPDSPEEEPSSSSPSPRGAFANAAEAPPPKKPPEPEVFGEITFSTFLMSLSTQALMCLGEIPNPATNLTETDLHAVQELIDIIGMLQQKTRGNLDAAESRLIEKILFDLRMRYVEKVRK
jgi:hypothetical protein